MRLVLVSGPGFAGGSAQHPIPEGGVTVGRAEDNGLVLADPAASRHHFRITQDAQGWILEDLGSRAGTAVNGSAVRACRLLGGETLQAGGTVLRLLADAPPPPPPPPPPPVARRAAPPPPARPPRRPPSRGRALLLGLSGLGLLGGACLLSGGLYLTRGFTNLALLPSILKSIASNGWSGRLNPAAPKASGAPAVDVRTLPGVRVTAPRNAMDKAREVRLAPVGGAWAKAIQSAAAGRREVAVAAFRVDAGMTDQDLFPGAMTVGLDLAQKGIPKELWPDARFVHVDDGGRFTEMETSLKGSELSCRASHNSIFAVLIGTGYGAAVAVMVSADQKFQGEASWNSITSENFKAYWPARLPPRDPAVFNPVNDELQALWDRYLAQALDQVGAGDLDPGAPSPPLLTAYARYLGDPRVRELAPLMKDRDWLMDHFVPPQVGSGLGVLERCYTYLTAERWRGFKQPTFKVDVLFRATWTHGANVLAMTVGSYVLYPYIDLNLNGIPAGDFDPQRLDPAFDTLHANCVHELFHAIQKTYYSGNPAEVEWFLEATAVVLEAEAQDQFVGAGFMGQAQPFDRPYWGAFFQPLQWSGGDEVERRHHGYGASYFLEHLRDAYYTGGDREKFLAAVFLDFGSWRGTPVGSLQRATSNSERELGEDFREFCVAQGSVLLSQHSPGPGGEGAAELTPESPVVKWKLAVHRPLATRMLSLKLRQPKVFRKGEGEVEPPAPLLLLRANPREADRIYLYATQGGKTWTPVSGKDLLFTPGKSSKGTEHVATLQRIEAYVGVDAKFQDTPKMAYPGPGATPDQAIDRGERVDNEAVALFSPPPAEVDKLTPAKAKVVWRPDALARNGLVLKYRVTAQVKGGKRKPVEVETDKPEAEFDLEKVFGKDGPEPGDVFEVIYRERVKADSEVWGPPSVPLKVEMDDPFTGRWVGPITIETAKIQDAIENGLVKVFGEGARDVLKKEQVVGSTNTCHLEVVPRQTRGAAYDIALRFEQREKWTAWEAKGTGDVEGDALVAEFRHPDGTTFVFTLRPESKDALKGTWKAGAFLMSDALTGSLSARREGPPRGGSAR